MQKEIKFPTQTGTIGFQLNFKPINTTGLWSFQIGASGNSDMALSFSGINGRVYDQDANFICGYGNKDVDIRGIIETGHYSYYADGVLTKIEDKEQLDFNYAVFNYEEVDRVNIEISGYESPFDNKSILFLTNNETGDYQWINFFKNLIEDVTVSNAYTGEQISGRTADLEEYDMIVLGNSVGEEIETVTGVWNLVNKPKVITSPLTAHYLNLIAYPTYNLCSVSGVNGGSANIGRKIGGVITSFDNDLLSTTGLVYSGQDLALVSYNITNQTLIEIFFSGYYSHYNFADNYYMFNLPSGTDNLTDDGRQLFINFTDMLVNNKEDF